MLPAILTTFADIARKPVGCGVCSIVLFVGGNWCYCHPVLRANTAQNIDDAAEICFAEISWVVLASHTGGRRAHTGS